jgi:hypothetical protein
MVERRESGFEKAGRFLLELAMLMLLAVGLCKVVVPEVFEVLRDIKRENGAKAEVQENASTHPIAPTDISGDR